MDLYLLFDSGCQFCTKVARDIQQETQGLLYVRSLHDPRIREILDKVRPSWKWEPMLLEIASDNTKHVYTGVKMQLRLVSQLGIAKSLRIAKLIHEAEQTGSVRQTGRRTFFKNAAGLAAGLAVLGLRPGNSQANSVAGEKVFLPMISNGIVPLSAGEADQALHLMLNSSQLAELERQNERNGVKINIIPERLEPMKVQNEVIYAAGQQAVTLSQTKAGHRFCTVVLGTESPDPHSRDSVFVGFVDIQHEAVLEIFQFDIASERETGPASTGDDEYRIVVKDSQGWRLESVTQRGQVILAADDEAALTDLGPKERCQIAAALLCGFAGDVVACGTFCGAICAVTAGLACPACFAICWLLFTTICSQSGNNCTDDWPY